MKESVLKQEPVCSDSSVAIRAALLLLLSLTISPACTTKHEEASPPPPPPQSASVRESAKGANNVPAVAQSPAAVPPAAFAYVYPAWHDKNDFKRISEYFTWVENTSGDILVRSTPEVREGLYFSIGMPFREGFPAGSTLQIEYLRGDNRDTLSQVFTLPASPNNPFFEIHAGLTGPHWASKAKAKARARRGAPVRPNSEAEGEKIRLIAWRVTLRAPDGRAWQNRSFLWQLPDAEK